MPRPRPRSVLVVDDSADAADSTAVVLNLHGFDARAVGSGAAALAAVAADRPDAVVLELAVRGAVDGWEAARRLAALDGSRPLVVAVTVCGRADDRRRAAAAGVDAFLVKPADPGELVEVLQRGRVTGK